MPAIGAVAFSSGFQNTYVRGTIVMADTNEASWINSSLLPLSELIKVNLNKSYSEAQLEKDYGITDYEVFIYSLDDLIELVYKFEKDDSTYIVSAKNGKILSNWSNIMTFY